MLKTYRGTLFACCVGYISEAIVISFPSLLFLIFRDTFGISLGKITLLITANFIIQLVVDTVSAGVVDKIGYRRCIVAALILMSLGIGLMAVLPFLIFDAFTGLIICTVICAVGCGLAEVLVSPIVEACPSDNPASKMSLLHSFYCWGCAIAIFVTTAFLFFFGKGSWRTLALILAAVPLTNAVLFLFVPIRRLTEDGREMSLKELLRSPKLLLFLLVMTAAGASEVSMSQWASAFAESGLHISKTVGDIAGPLMFAVLMGTARTVVSKIGGKIDFYIGIAVCGAVCAVSYLLASLSENAVVSLIGCAFCGLSVGIMWPGSMSLVAREFPRGGTVMFALLALFGDVGCSLGPTAVGFISEQYGDNLKKGLLFGTVFPIIITVGAIIFKIASKRSKSYGG